MLLSKIWGGKHPNIHSFCVGSLQQIPLKNSNTCYALKSTVRVESGKLWLLQALTWTDSKAMKCKHLKVWVLTCLVWWGLWLRFLSTWLLHVTSPHSLSTEASLDFFSEQKVRLAQRVSVPERKRTSEREIWEHEQRKENKEEAESRSPCCLWSSLGSHSVTSTTFY